MDDQLTASRAEAQSRRQDEILQMTRGQGRVEVADLAEHFGVTGETIRRDLTDLQDQRLVRRVHGGAVPWETVRFEPTLRARDTQHTDEKRRIATAAVSELPPEGTVILDSGSTTSMFASYFPRDRALRVVTNSLFNARTLSDRDLIDVVVLGGRLKVSTLAMVDIHTVEALRSMTADTVFVGCDGISLERGLTTPYDDECAVKGAMIGAARRVVALADSSKLGNDQFRRFAEVTDVDTLITDSGADPTVVAGLEAAGLSVVVA